MEIKIIKNPGLEELKPVVILLNRIFKNSENNKEFSPVIALEKMQAAKDPLALEAYEANVMVGFLLAYERTPGFMHLWELGVDDQYRNQGIASALYEYLEGFARESAYQGVTINTFNRFPQSLRLAIKRGYKIYELDNSGEFEKDPKIKLKLTFDKP